MMCDNYAGCSTHHIIVVMNEQHHVIFVISITVREVMQKSELDQAKQVRGSRTSAGLQVKWRQVVK